MPPSTRSPIIPGIRAAAQRNPPLAAAMPTPALRDAVRRHITYSLGVPPEGLTPRELLHAVALAIRDRLVDGELATERRYRVADAKRLYYLSMEFLIGRSLTN